jgi:hypothetical protein
MCGGGRGGGRAWWRRLLGKRWVYALLSKRSDPPLQLLCQLWCVRCRAFLVFFSSVGRGECDEMRHPNAK